MPLGRGVNWAVRTTKSGKRIRLAFKGGKVIEAKNIDSGAIHTAAEFANDRRKTNKERKAKQKKRTKQIKAKRVLKRALTRYRGDK